MRVTAHSLYHVWLEHRSVCNKPHSIMNDLEIVELGTKDTCDEDWQQYVEACPQASLYHRLEWREILSRTFGHNYHYLMARDHGRVCGVLPLVEMRSPLFGHFFVSLPFVNHGGILGDTPEVEAALATAAAHMADKTTAKHIELRQQTSGAGWPETSDWKLRQHKAALVVKLAADPEPLWAAISSRLRGKVRKAEKAQASFRITGAEGLNDFYTVFSLNMRDLGTPVYSSDFFRNVLALSPGSRILLVHLGERPVAAAVAVQHGDRLELPWICSDYTQSSSYVNEYLYWKAIEWACRSGASELDLGRSSIDAGTYRFKIQWNPDIRPLFWYYHLAPGVGLPELNPNNPKYALAVQWWKKMPVGLANRIGPWIVRNIP